MEPLAQRIRDNPNISGARFGGTEHKLCLYADDVVATLENPNTSLPAFLEQLEKFSSISGFKINVHKSQALALSMMPNTRIQLQQTFPLQWADDSIPYLGLSISGTISATRSANYAGLLARVRNSVRKWRPHSLSWLGRVAAVKMVILPQILYIFHTLPLLPPKGAIHTLQRDIEHFVWRDQRA